MKMINRKRLIAFLAVIVIVFSITIYAYAHIPCLCNNPSDQCTCFIQLGDKGLAVEKIVAVLKMKGYLSSTEKNEFTPEVKQAVIKFQKENNLECTGWMDDETLDALLFDVLPDESMKGSMEFWDAICFVPTDGGQRHHSNPACSDMLNPRMISRVNATSLGIKPCGKNTCTKATALTYSSLGLTPRDLPASYYEEEMTEANAVIQKAIPSDDVESAFVGNKKSHVFHRSTCSFASSMSEKNRVEFSSRDEAIEKGYKPCGKCNP